MKSCVFKLFQFPVLIFVTADHSVALQLIVHGFIDFWISCNCQYCYDIPVCKILDLFTFRMRREPPVMDLHTWPPFFLTDIRSSLYDSKSHKWRVDKRASCCWYTVICYSKAESRAAVISAERVIGSQESSAAAEWDLQAALSKSASRSEAGWEGASPQSRAGPTHLPMQVEHGLKSQLCRSQDNFQSSH